MKKIRQGEIKMTPKWVFDAKEGGKKGVLALMVITSCVFLVLFWYFFRLLNVFELKDYGDIGKQILIEEFPYFYLFGAIILITGVIGFYSQVGDNYKKSLSRIFIFALFAIACVTLILLMAGSYVELELLLKLI